jgi:hypothetical protein
MSGSKMASYNTSAPSRREPLARIGQITWSIVRFPALAFLVLIEPLARFVLGGSSLLCFFTAFFFKWVSADPRFPFCGLLHSSIALAAALFLYEGLIDLLSRR